MIIDSELEFHKHTAAAIKKANMKLGMIKKSFSCLDESVVLLLYTSLVRSHLEYGNLIWGPHFKGDSIAVEKLQRRATKLVPTIRDMSYDERLRHLQLPSLLHRRRRGDVIFGYKLFTGKIGMEKDDIFSPSLAAVRGQEYRVIRRKATKLCRINTFSNRIIDDWNALPKLIVAAASTDSFKNSIDKHWKKEQFLTPF